MSMGFFKFELSEFSCTCLSDGSLDYPLQNYFKDVPLVEIEAALQKMSLPTDYITTPYTYLFVETHQNQVLIDMGAGHLGPRTGKLLASMDAARVDPLKIDTVVITHAHPDHIGGTLDDQGNLNYPNAVYFISKVEWDFWFSDSALETTPASFVETARENLSAIKARVNHVEGEEELIPGVYAIPAPGHTPGHMVARVISGNEQLFYIGDTVLYPLHLEHPNWLPIYDILPDKASASKRAIFDRVSDEKALVIGQHFPPFPSLGYVIKGDVGWHWQPIHSNS